MAKYKAPTYNPKSSNYNYKPRSNFGQKIKNFFNVDIEKDLQEEEGQKVFQRTKLFDLNRYNLFIFLALFFIIVNILVGFNLNFLYIRQILGFLFLILIPGLLIMLCFKIRKVGFWEYLVYTIGLSVAFIMFAGLAVNWTLPLLGITDKPLSLYPILISFDLFLIILGVVAWKRNQDLEHQFTTPKLDKLNNVFFIIPMLFPVLSVLGAFLLNNHGPNILTMIMLGGIAVYVLFLVIFRKRLNENIWPWALYWMGLALLLMFSMRSWNISASDASLEYGISKRVLSQGYWNFWSLQGNYSAMLSVSLLPGLISLFSNIPLIFISKLCFPIIFSLFFICLFSISKRILPKTFSFFSVLFILFQPMIVNFERFPPRQQIAFIFLGIIFLLLLEIKINYSIKSTLLVIFGISLAVSHYSTMIIFLLCLFLIYLIQLFFSKHPKFNGYKVLSFLLIFILLSFSFLWYSQLTNTSDSFLYFGQKSISNLGSLFKDEMYSLGNSPLEQLSLFKSKQYNPSIDLQNYTLSTGNLSSDSINLLKEYPSHLMSGSRKNINFSEGFLKLVQEARASFMLLSKLLLLLGVAVYFLSINKSYRYNSCFFIVGLGLLIVFFVLVILPFASMNYNLDRVYSQMLILLSPISVFGLYKLFQLFKLKHIFIIAYITFILLFLLNSFYFFHSLSGGNDLSMSLDNFGSEYDTLYVSSLEIKSSIWMNYNSVSKTFFADNYAKFKLYQSLNIEGYQISTNILPTTIKDNYFVYSSKSNTINGITFKYYGRGLLVYNYPTKFLNENKNKIYNNGGSQIFE